MALSQDIINQFVDLTKQEKTEKEVTVNGLYKKIDGKEYVQLDGSDILTPVTSVVDAETRRTCKSFDQKPYCYGNR